MFKNYLLIALRNARRNKFYVIVNVLGLGLGLACCLTAYLMIAYNLEFDAYFEDTEKIYRVQRTLQDKEASSGVAEIIPLPLAASAEGEISGVEEASRVYVSSELLRNEDNVFRESIGFVDTNFFDFFEYQTVFGETGSFERQDKIVLNEELAAKFFGDKNPVGASLTLRFGDGQEVPLTVGAVVRYPLNISFFYDAFIPLPHVIASGDYDKDDWNASLRPSTFLKLSSPDMALQVDRQLSKFVETANASEITYLYEDFSIIPFIDASVNETDLKRTYTNRRINPMAVMIFSLMAFAILLLACFNLTNTSIALAARRLKEIGVRKVMGGMRYQLIFQLLIEILMIGVLAIGAGWLIAQYLVPVFTGMFEIAFSLQDISLWNMSVALMLLLVLIAMIAGLYPAIYSTGFRPATILKGNMKLKNSNWFTRSLLSLQFALSIALLIGGFVSVLNAKYLQKLELGYDVHQLISLDELEPQEAQLLLNEIRENPKIESASALRGSAIWGSNSDMVEVDTSALDTRIYEVSANYIQTVGMKISEGRDFNEQMVSDFSEAVLVNQTFVEEAGWEQAINQRVIYQDTARYVIGVVENIVNGFYENEQQAAIFTQVKPARYNKILLRTDTDALTVLYDEMKATWKELIPFKPYSASYLTETAMYYPLREMRVMKQVYFFLALLGGLLATAGIFSLAQISVARRNKEIGVRKVLGASVKTIVNTVNREFIWILAVAAVLGCSIGYLFSETILSGVYAFHVDIGPWPLVLSGGIIVGIALLTTSITIFRSANTNPVNVLRDE